MKTITLLFAMCIIGTLTMNAQNPSVWNNKQANNENSITKEDLPKPIFAPFVDMCAWNNETGDTAAYYTGIFDISNVELTGVCYYVMAFIVDDPYIDGVQPTWGGYSAYNLETGNDYNTQIHNMLTSLRSQGGDGIISIGGENGIPIAAAANTPEEAFQVYKQIVDEYDVKIIDFDVEGYYVAEPISIARRSQAMKLLQDEYPDIKFWLTIPSLTSGPDGNGVGVIQSAIDAGVELSGVNLMTMCFNSGGDLGDHTISAAHGLFAELQAFYPNRPDSVLWGMVGVTPMIGQNTQAADIFWQEDAAQVRDFAIEKKIGMVCMWSINRDKPGTELYNSTMITSTPWEFTQIFNDIGVGGLTMNYCILVSTNDLQLSSANIKVYPNPVNDILHIQLNNFEQFNNAEVYIYNMLGSVVYISDNIYDVSEINVSDYQSGIYFLEIVTENNDKIYTKFIKN